MILQQARACLAAEVSKQEAFFSWLLNRPINFFALMRDGLLVRMVKRFVQESHSSPLLPLFLCFIGRSNTCESSLSLKSQEALGVFTSMAYSPITEVQTVKRFFSVTLALKIATRIEFAGICFALKQKRVPGRIWKFEVLCGQFDTA